MPDTAAMLQAAESILPKIADQPGQTGYDIHASQDLVLERPELFAWGLHDRILNIAEAGMGVPAAFNDIHIRRDFANGVKSGSRLWHVDSYDHRILRIIIYLSDVSKTGGAHEYIPRQKSRFWVTVLEHFGTIPDKVMEKLGLQKHVRSCPGPKGTVIFSMTSRVLHRGTVPQDSERYTLIYNYNSRSPKRPQEASPRVPRDRLMNIVQQFPKRQQDCMLWK
ncbi:2OG-Fe(II) oxygenase [Pseudanabaena sp. FACHB-2040]|uniref:2OG-Fe(II) oxygenase n=1 Tax=Pseudanabaena sp. FACHB-2040 TaxID=2692859 RepID=UPI001688A4EB|nr:2OG-Fe(II) oxygenase [Pseudanabaena sp. FACHB-2040]MBD2259145.1 2OG-Fe(II) oxygenase [Pseudanabaena sp. FACHB-2040]